MVTIDEKIKKLEKMGMCPKDLHYRNSSLYKRWVKKKKTKRR